MSAVWAKLETHVVNGAYPLQRCVGSTAHSGVFLTQSTKHAPSAAALKLIPLERESAQLQLARWRAAAALSHPHLLRIFEVGECRIDGRPFLFARMEYADQTLAQLLERRALTQDEAREMLEPTLEALEYLHRSRLVQGALKPSNVLVVGDQLKLASDTVRPIEAADADAAAAADVHALGATLCEALTRLRPAGLDGAVDVALPPELPASFRGIVARCLSRDPRHRPTAAELLAWLRAGPATRLVIRVELPAEEPPAAAARPARTSRRSLPWILGALVVLAGAAGYAVFSSAPRSSRSPGNQATQQAPRRIDARSLAGPGTAAISASAPAPARPAASADATAGAAVSEAMPDVSQSALDTIRGTIRVRVRLTVDANGAVVAATAEDPGPSRYFERRSLQAARKWTFAPTQAAEQRSVRLRFSFTRSGVTANAEPLP